MSEALTIDPHAAETPVTERRLVGLTFHGITAASAFLLVAATVLGLAGRFHWALDLLAHQRRVYAVLLLLTLLALLMGKRWRWAAFAGAGLAINLGLLAPLYLSTPHAPAADATPLRLISYNVLTANTNHAEVADYLAASRAHLIALLEVNDAWLVDIRKHLPGYHIVADQPRADNFGIALLVKDALPPGVVLQSAQIIHPDSGPYELPAAEAMLAVDGREIMLLAVHPVPPMNPTNASSNRHTHAWVADWSQRHTAAGRAHVIVGDLNATPFSHAFRDMMSRTELVNSQQGYGWCPSWPDRFEKIGLQIPIDHCLHSPELTTVHRGLGPTLGSDHRPLQVELAWRRPE